MPGGTHRPAAALTGEEQARLLDLLEKLAGGREGGGCSRRRFSGRLNWAALP